jgi:hypothetical protein
MAIRPLTWSISSFVVAEQHVVAAELEPADRASVVGDDVTGVGADADRLADDVGHALTGL